MEKTKEMLKQYKWVLLAGIIVAILIGLVTANFHVLQFVKYKATNNRQGVVSILQARVSNNNQKEWYFEQGMAYLLGQDTYTEEITTFFENNFESFSKENQLEIIKGYQQQQLKLPLNKELMVFLIANKQEHYIKQYIQAISPIELEKGLSLVYGNQPKVDQTFIRDLNEILAFYPQELPFEKFQFDLYEMLRLAKGESLDEAKAILGQLNAEKARKNLMDQIKSQPITEQQLVNWVKLFKDTEMITVSEYNEFDKLYTDICMIRSQYQGLDQEKIDLENKKELVETQISETSRQLQAKEKEISNIKTEISQVENELEQLTNYAYMPLYIERASGTGNNEYIASVPKGGLFGSLRPSSQKYIVKLTQSTFLKEGVYNLNVYLDGSKTTANGAQYAYYVEVSQAKKGQMETLTKQRENKISARQKLEKEAATMQSQIKQVKAENNYDEVIAALNSMESKRSEYASHLTKKVAEIKSLFGLSQFSIDIDDAN